MTSTLSLAGCDVVSGGKRCRCLQEHLFSFYLVRQRQELSLIEACGTDKGESFHCIASRRSVTAVVVIKSVKRMYHA